MQSLSRYSPNPTVRPWWVFLLVMLIVFTAEGAIMLALPMLPAWTRSPVAQSIIDASLLTLITAPAVWRLVVLPMRRLFEARGQLLHQVFHAQEQERARIARDLHDEIGQHLTALLVGLKTVEMAADLDTAKHRASDLRQLTAVAHEEVRRLAHGLRPGVLEEMRLAAAIERLCEEFQSIHQVPVKRNISATACEQLTKDAELCIFRVIQESLTNAARHADATQIDVAIECRDNTIVLTIADNGTGFDRGDDSITEQASNTIGLASIRERASILGGKCLIQSRTGKGTTVQVIFPVPGPQHG